MRAAAEDLDLRHRQTSPAGRRRGIATAARRATPRPHARAAIDTATSRCRRGATCSACRRARSARRRSPPGRARRGRRAPRAISPRDVGAAPCSTSRPPKRAPPSRRSTASRDPREAPAGAIARRRAPSASATSASTVGRPRESQTRRADRTMAVALMCDHCGRLQPRRIVAVRPSVLTDRAVCQRPAMLPGSDGDAQRARSADARLVGFGVMYSTGDLPSTRASSRPGNSAAARRSIAVARLPVDTRRDTPRASASNAARNAARRRRRPHALQQQVVEAERDVERRIAAPRAFGIEEHRPVGPDQDVLRADVAMHEGARVALRRADQRGERGARSGWARPVASRYGSRRMAKKIASVAKRAASSGRAAVARGCAPARHRRRRAVAASIAPSRSCAFQSGCRPGGS